MYSCHLQPADDNPSWWGVGFVPWQEAMFPSPHHPFTAMSEWKVRPSQLSSLHRIQTISSYQIQICTTELKRLSCAENNHWSIMFSWMETSSDHWTLMDTVGLSSHPFLTLKTNTQTHEHTNSTQWGRFETRTYKGNNVIKELLHHSKTPNTSIPKAFTPFTMETIISISYYMHYM